MVIFVIIFGAMAFSVILNTVLSVVFRDVHFTVDKYGNKYLSNKKITTLWKETKITDLLDYMKSHNLNNRSIESNSIVKISSNKE